MAPTTDKRDKRAKRPNRPASRSEPAPRPVADLLRPQRAPTPGEAEAVREVHELAAEWAAGRLPVWEVRRLSSGRQRWLATAFTPPADPRFAVLMRLLDALIATAETPRGDLIRTRQGVFDRQDLLDAEARIERDEHGELIVFPVRYPWQTKPDPERGAPGVRGPAAYRPAKERGPIYRAFAVTPPPRPAASPQPERPWWDEDDDEGA